MVRLHILRLNINTILHIPHHPIVLQLMKLQAIIHQVMAHLTTQPRLSRVPALAEACFKDFGISSTTDKLFQKFKYNGS
jgi:hypothetical protein